MDEHEWYIALEHPEKDRAEFLIEDEALAILGMALYFFGSSTLYKVSVFVGCRTCREETEVMRRDLSKIGSGGKDFMTFAEVTFTLALQRAAGEKPNMFEVFLRFTRILFGHN